MTLPPHLECIGDPVTGGNVSAVSTSPVPSLLGPSTVSGVSTLPVSALVPVASWVSFPSPSMRVLRGRGPEDPSPRRDPGP